MVFRLLPAHLGNKAKILHKSRLHVHTCISIPLGKATARLSNTMWFQPIISMAASPHSEHQRKSLSWWKGVHFLYHCFRVRKKWEIRNERKGDLSVCQMESWNCAHQPHRRQGTRPPWHSGISKGYYTYRARINPLSIIYLLWDPQSGYLALWRLFLHLWSRDNDSPDCRAD